MKAKKSLGQNFLKSKAALSEIIRAAELKKEDCVLEVGPGKGTLTEALLQSGCRVITVEKDDRLISILTEKFATEIASGRLELIHGDILELEPEKILNDERKYKIVANIPYYITGTFLRKFLTAELQPTSMVLLLQKEVARRIVAADRKESLLSLSVKCFGRPRYIKKVPARSFAPAPKVDSAILLIEDISRKFFLDNNIDEEKFFTTLKAGFAHKRKFLISNLKDLATRSLSKKEAAPATAGAAATAILKEKFRQCDTSEKSRAEDLSLENWKCLVEN